MDDRIASEMLSQLMRSLVEKGSADEAARVTDPDEGEPQPLTHAPHDADAYVFHGRRPFAPPRHVWVTWRDQDLFLGTISA